VRTFHRLSSRTTVITGCPAWPAGVAIGPRVVGIGSHQSLLNGEDQIVCGMQCGRGQRWIVASKPDLQGSDRLAQWRRCLRLIA